MSGPKRNDRSAPSTCPLTVPRRWWICWSMRCSIAGVLPWPRRATASRNRRRCGGSTGRRSTPSPAPTSTPRSGSSTPSRASSPPPDAATGAVRRSESAVDLALLEMAANGTALDAGQAALVRQMCTSGARLQLAIAPAGAGKTTAMRALTLAWTARWRPGDRPRPVGCRGRCPRRANRDPQPTHSPNSPGPCSTASCPTGRPRSARRHW